MISFRHGRLPHDPARVAACPTHRMSVLMPAPVLDLSMVPFIPGMFGNDTIPDCTAAGLANSAMAAALASGFALEVEAGMVPAFYGDCVGNPSDLAATDGAIVVDVFDKMTADGIALATGRPYRSAWGTVPLTRMALAGTMARPGAAYWGITLHEADEAAFEAGSVMDIGGDPGAETGGHVIVGWDYTGLSDDSVVRIATWGTLARCTWRWVAARLDEAYGLVWPQLQAAAPSP